VSFTGINNKIGIKPIPGIEDVDFEEADIEFDVLFPDTKAQQSGNPIECRENDKVNN